MLVKFVTYIPAIIGLLSISLFVLLNNVKASKNIIFSLLTFFTACWLGALYIGDSTSSVSIALWSLRFGLFFVALMFYFLYLFALVFPFRTKIKLLWQTLIALPFLITVITSFSGLQVKTVSISGFGVQPDSVGSLYAISDFTAILYVLAAIGLLVYKYKKSDRLQKTQIRFVLYGITIALIINIFTGMILTLLKINSDLIVFGSLSIFVFALFVAYAIIWQGFLDIRSLVARTVGYVLSLGSIAAVSAIFLYSTSGKLENIGATEAQLRLFYVGIAVVLAIIYQPVKTFFDKLTNKYFYQDAYEPQNLLNDLNTSLVSLVDVDNIIKDSALLVEHYLKSSYVMFFVHGNNKAKNLFATNSKHQNDLVEIEKISKRFPEKVVGMHDESVISRELLKSANRYDIGLVAHLKASSKSDVYMGSIVLGIKKSGSIYGKQDYRVMEIIADELAIAIQNALHFEEIQQFNATLQKKVDDATKELKKANEKLIALDQTKDDFISMASHQLRTPLTSVKGYISMVVEGDVGKISKQQHKLLDQAFLSSQRMVYLIADLLNVSRLKTGKFIIEPKPTNLADLVEGELSQLTETAKSRDLTLNFEKPANFPLLMLDDTKTRQVVMNFADNAIYYTMSGGKIDVIVEDTGKTIEFTVTDNGIGVPKNERHNLFSKFYRANNAKKARPDGTGLGLFMAKKVIIAQGGSIIFKSEEGKGSTFGFSFDKARLKVPDTKIDKHNLDK